MISFMKETLTRLKSRPPRDYRKLCMASKIIYLSLIPTALVYLIARLSPAFSDFFNRYISQPLRLIYAKLTNLFPFSFAEALLLLLPPFISSHLPGAFESLSPSRVKVQAGCLLPID